MGAAQSPGKSEATTMLIERMEHIALAVLDAPAAAADYATMLGCAPAESGDGPSRALRLENIALILEPAPDGKPDPGSGVPLRLVFATSNPAAKHRLERRGLPGTVVGDRGRIDLDPAATHGVSMSIVRSAGAAQGGDANSAQSDIAGLDHVVIRTPDPERAVALYGGRLGLDLRLDRTNAQFGVRQIFFVCGDLVVEIVHSLKQASREGPDVVWGLAWRANDLDRAHSRMLAAGIAASEMRDGRRDGTRVFTVKSHVAGVPTLVIGGQGLKRS